MKFNGIAPDRVLLKRLQAWKLERETNSHKLAAYAEHAIISILKLIDSGRRPHRDTPEPR